MDKRFKPLLAAAVAAGIIPVLDHKDGQAQAVVVTAANFGFESLSSTGTTVSSISYIADSASPGYGGSMTAALGQSSTGGFFSPAGNGTPRALSANAWTSGGSYTFKFDIDGLNQVFLAFDSRGSNTGPRDFVVQYSRDGVNYTTATNYAISNVGWASSTSVTGTFYQFALPASFSDTNAAPGDFGFIQLLQSGATNVTGGTIASAGTNAIDNVFITDGPVPEPTTALVMTLAAAGLSLRPRRRD